MCASSKAFQGTIAEVFLIAVSLTIAAVSEGLPAIVTIRLALGMREIIKRHALIRKLSAALVNDAALEVTGSRDGRSTYRMVGDPAEAALLVAAAKASLRREALETRYPRVAEVPFDSARKHMSTIHALRQIGEVDPHPGHGGRSNQTLPAERPFGLAGFKSMRARL